MKSTLFLLAALALSTLPSHGQSSGGTLYIGGGSGTTNTNSTYSATVFDRADVLNLSPTQSLSTLDMGGSTNAIPEPTSATLLAIAAVGLVSRRRRLA